MLSRLTEVSQLLSLSHLSQSTLFVHLPQLSKSLNYLCCLNSVQNSINYVVERSMNNTCLTCLNCLNFFFNLVVYSKCSNYHCNSLRFFVTVSLASISTCFAEQYMFQSSNSLHFHRCLSTKLVCHCPTCLNLSHSSQPSCSAHTSIVKQSELFWMSLARTALSQSVSVCVVSVDEFVPTVLNFYINSLQTCLNSLQNVSQIS